MNDQANKKKKKRPVDINQLAASIVSDATSEDEEETEEDNSEDDGKNPAAVALGRLGGKKGGKAVAGRYLSGLSFGRNYTKGSVNEKD